MGQAPSNGNVKNIYSVLSFSLAIRFSHRELNRSLSYQHVPIPARTTLCRKGCCTVTWCPLEISWATTIHKFQGFEAGFDINDVFRHLIVDPGDLNWEQMCPGALYVALSRAKTMGTFRDDTSFPRDSAIYWYGSGLSTTRILNGHLKKNTRRKTRMSSPCSQLILISLSFFSRKVMARHCSHKYSNISFTVQL